MLEKSRSVEIARADPRYPCREEGGCWGATGGVWSVEHFAFFFVEFRLSLPMWYVYFRDEVPSESKRGSKDIHNCMKKANTLKNMYACMHMGRYTCTYICRETQPFVPSPAAVPGESCGCYQVNGRCLCILPLSEMGATGRLPLPSAFP